MNADMYHHRYGKIVLATLLKHLKGLREVQQTHSQLIISGVLAHQCMNMMLWNDLLRQYFQFVSPRESLILFQNSHPRSYFLDSFTYRILIKSCNDLSDITGGLQIHALTFKIGFLSNVYIQTAFVELYTNFGYLVDACSVFWRLSNKHVVTWNVLITGLIKWGELNAAHSLFNQMKIRTVISWTSIIGGYSHDIQPKKALSLFRQMTVDEGIRPTVVTLLAILPAISDLGDFRICRSVHAYREKHGFSDIRILNSFVDTYSKCGCVRSALKVFEEIPNDRRSLVSWTSIVAGLAMHGRGKEALEIFEKMEQSNLKPNRVAFSGILNACSHGGLVEEGICFFKRMVQEFEIDPDVKHFGCLVDMLGRAGRLEEAEGIALEIHIDATQVEIWRTLLGACSIYGYASMAERVATKLIDMGSACTEDYILLSNTFSGVGKFEDAARWRMLMCECSASKPQGWSLCDWMHG